MKKYHLKRFLNLVLVSSLFTFTWGLHMAPDALAASVVKAEPRAGGNVTAISGKVIAIKEAALAAQLPGTVNYLAGKEGDFFTKNAVLFAVDDSALRAKRRAAVAAMMAADSAFRTAQVQYRQELYSPRTGQPTGMGMPGMMDNFMKPFTGQYAGPHNPWVNRQANLQSRAEGIEAAKNQLAQARAAIDEIDTKLHDAQIKAPFDGVIVSRSVERGDTVQPGRPLIKFVDTSAMLVEAQIPERLTNGLKVGDEIKARLDIKGGKEVPIQVNQIYPTADARRHTVRVKFALETQMFGQRASDVVRPGMYAEVLVPEMSGNAPSLPSVPVTALDWKGSLRTVLICVNSKKSIRYVTAGDPSPGGYVNILSGVSVGDMVIANPHEGDNDAKCREMKAS